MSVNVIVMFVTDDMEPVMDIHPDTDLHELVGSMEELDGVAESLSVKPLSSFLVSEEGDEDGEEEGGMPKMHSIKRGLKTVQALVEAMAATPDAADLTQELRALERCLEEGAKRASRFCLMTG